jgi:hypothetical protein
MKRFATTSLSEIDNHVIEVREASLEDYQNAIQSTPSAFKSKSHTHINFRRYWLRSSANEFNS